MSPRLTSSQFLTGLFGFFMLAGIGACGSGQDSAGSGAGLTKDEALSRLQVGNDLRQIALSFEGFVDNDRTQQLPPADGSGYDPYVQVGDEKNPLLRVGLSWRAYHQGDLQPIDKIDDAKLKELQAAINKLGQKPNKDEVKPKGQEPWDIAAFKDIKLSPYSSPVPGKTKQAWDTFFRVFIGNGAAFEPGKRMKWADFTDGRDKTILVVEAGDAVPWTKPDELKYDPTKPLPKLGGQFSDGFYALFADFKVRFIKNGTDEKLIRAMITRNGKEVIAELPQEVDFKILRKAAGYTD